MNSLLFNSKRRKKHYKPVDISWAPLCVVNDFTQIQSGTSASLPSREQNRKKHTHFNREMFWTLIQVWNINQALFFWISLEHFGKRKFVIYPSFTSASSRSTIFDQRKKSVSAVSTLIYLSQKNEWTNYVRNKNKIIVQRNITISLKLQIFGVKSIICPTKCERVESKQNRPLSCIDATIAAQAEHSKTHRIHNRINDTNSSQRKNMMSCLRSDGSVEMKVTDILRR